MMANNWFRGAAPMGMEKIVFIYALSGIIAIIAGIIGWRIVAVASLSVFIGSLALTFLYDNIGRKG